jgi:hypothetical protein
VVLASDDIQMAVLTNRFELQEKRNTEYHQ